MANSPGVKLPKMSFTLCTHGETPSRYIFMWIFITMASALPLTDANDGNLTEEVCTTETKACKKGLILPVWEPKHNYGTPEKILRALVYLFAMHYMFIGVSIVSDRFMGSIEVITSKYKHVKIYRTDGTVEFVQVLIWNETVANLTLMALGSSAPEIMLSVIEICGNNFDAGDLGPSTIVGSAAFNLFIITAICVYCIPTGEVRIIYHLNVFFVTSAWSIFAYLWLFIIVSLSSEGVVELWEGLVTLAFFPITVFTAYLADSKRKFCATRKIIAVSSKDNTTIMQAHSDVASKTDIQSNAEIPKTHRKSIVWVTTPFATDPLRQEYIDVFMEMRKKHPDADMASLEALAENEFCSRSLKTRAFYRVLAGRKIKGGGHVLPNQRKTSIAYWKATLEADESDSEEPDPECMHVFFSPGHYTVMENVGNASLTIRRQGGDLSKRCCVDYRTRDGSAKANKDYSPQMATISFQPHEIKKHIEIPIIDDSIFDEDQYFYVELASPRCDDSAVNVKHRVEISEPTYATVLILDDDHPGVFRFKDSKMDTQTIDCQVEVKVMRVLGTRGTVTVPYYTQDDTAKENVDYDRSCGELIFNNDENTQSICIDIHGDINDNDEPDKTFNIVLGEPHVTAEFTRGSSRDPGIECKKSEKSSLVSSYKSGINKAKPQLKDPDQIRITITSSSTKSKKDSFSTAIPKSTGNPTISILSFVSSWRDQLVEAFTVTPTNTDNDGASTEDEAGEERKPSKMDYTMHYITLIWKVLCALIPPNEYLGGWACFVCSILMIGLLTAIIGDLASHFGCTIGLKDSITAITFVALGTSVPDTFASKVAAINDRYADASIGNVTGSNAVNVFLGIGIAWTMAAIYHNSLGNQFVVKTGELGLSVTVFCCLALLAIVLLLQRRRACIGGELGGPKMFRKLTSSVLVLFWLTYVIVSALVAYCVIPGL